MWGEVGKDKGEYEQTSLRGLSEIPFTLENYREKLYANLSAISTARKSF